MTRSDDPRAGGCQHDLCRCAEAPVVVGGARYCSAACADEAAREWAACECGHAGCRADPRRSSGEERPAVSIAPGPGGCAPDPRAPLVPPERGL